MLIAGVSNVNFNSNYNMWKSSFTNLQPWTDSNYYPALKEAIKPMSFTRE